MAKSATSIFAAALGLSVAASASLAGAQDNTDPQFVSRDKSGNLTVEDDAAGFGEKGQWAFSTDAALKFSRTTQEDREATTLVSILPAADYFIIKNLSLGGVVGVEYTKAGADHSTRFKLGPRVGYNFEFSKLLSIWPKIGLQYAYTSGETPVTNPLLNPDGTPVPNSDGTLQRDTSNNAIALSLFAPVMLHPAAHFFAGLGPFLDVDLSGDYRATTWGFNLTMGGWI